MGDTVFGFPNSDVGKCDTAKLRTWCKFLKKSYTSTNWFLQCRVSSIIQDGQHISLLEHGRKMIAYTPDNAIIRCDFSNSSIRTTPTKHVWWTLVTSLWAIFRRSTGRRGSNSEIGCQEIRLLCGYGKQRMPKGHCNLLVCCWGLNTPFPSVLKKLGQLCSSQAGIKRLLTTGVRRRATDGKNTRSTPKLGVGLQPQSLMLKGDLVFKDFQQLWLV